MTFAAGRRGKWVTLLVWVLLVGGLGSLAAKVGEITKNDAKTYLPSSAESTRAYDIAHGTFGIGNTLDAVVVATRDGALRPTDLAFLDRARTELATLTGNPVPAVAVSRDRQAALLTGTLAQRSDNKGLSASVTRIRTQLHGLAPPDLSVYVTGSAGTGADYVKIFSSVDGRLLALTLGVVALILLLTYRSPVLWILPLLSAGIASQIGNGAVYLLGKRGLTVSGQAQSVLLVLVLGVATDYGLLILSRYREELHRHEDHHTALAVALRRALPPIAASAATVSLALLCLSLATMNNTKGLGPVCVVGVVSALLAMSTLLPALLAIVGRRIFWPRVPRAAADRPEHTDPASRAWPAIGRFVVTRSGVVGVGSTLLLALLAAGLLGLHTGQNGASPFTRPEESVTGQQALARHFAAGTAAPLEIYVPAAIADELRQRLTRVPGVADVGLAQIRDGKARIVATLTAQDGSSAAADTVERVRTAVRSDNKDVVVGGQPATSLDTRRAYAHDEKLLIPIILAVVLLTLVLLLRSVAVPVLLAAAAALSYASALGASSLVFHALGYPRVDPSLILTGFLFLVALGVDYTMFLMTRAREEVLHHGHRAGLVRAVSTTGAVITSAGVVLAATFALLATLPVISQLQQGVLVSIGVLLDTFVVRTLLVPASASALGPGAWWPTRPAKPLPALNPPGASAS